GTLRPWIANDDSFELMEVAPLDESDVLKFAGPALPEASPGLLGNILGASSGLPLHVEQLVRYLAEDGAEPLPSLADAVGARIARLPQDARTLLQAVALAGGEADEALIAAMDVDTAPESVSLLRDRGLLLVREGGRLQIRHPLFVDIAHEGIP